MENRPQRSSNSTTIAFNTHRAVCLLFLLLTLPLGRLHAAPATSGPKAIHNLYIAPVTGSDDANIVRERLAAHLRKIPSLHLVDTTASADAVLHCEAVIWPTGTVSVNPHSSGGVTNYQGYISAELSDADGHPLWSYLVTPSRFRTAGIIDNLADQLSAHLEAAIASGLSSASTRTASSGPELTLHVAGATFPAPLYQLWFRSFADESGVTLTYDAVGSVAGLDRLAARSIDMAASDIPAQSGAAPPVPAEVLHIPTVIGGVVPVYNLPGVSGDLNLTPPLLADIFSGKIHNWNDPRIREWNKGARLPDAPIAVVHRSDGSGTTYVFTSFLAQSSPDWKSRVGTTIDWPVGSGAPGNEGVAQQVAATPNSIAYVELTYAIQHHMSYASLRNPSGRFIHAGLDSIAAAIAAHTHTGDDDLRYSILNSPAKDAYPISTFTWLLVPRSGPDPQKRDAESRFLHWMLTTGQKQCASLGYVPLPQDIVREELQQLDTLR